MSTCTRRRSARLRMLIDKAEGRARPAIAIAKLPAILPSFNMRTADGPMAEMQQLAEGLCAGGSAASSTSRSMAASPTAIRPSPDRAWWRWRRWIEALAQRRDTLAAELAVEARAAVLCPPARSGRRPGAGDEGRGRRAGHRARPGGQSAVGRHRRYHRACSSALLEASAAEAGTVFALFLGPALGREMCHQMGAGAKFEAKLGGRVDAGFRRPGPGRRPRIVKLTDGKFRNEGPYEHSCRWMSAAPSCSRWARHPGDRHRKLPDAERPGLFPAARHRPQNRPTCSA